MAEVAWSRRALIELDLIRAYIRQFDPAAAERIAHRLRTVASSLSEFPNRGRPASRGRRELPTVAPYLIQYRVRGNMVIITSVKHSARKRN